MAEPLPADALTFLLQAVGSLDALRILVLLRRDRDRTWSSDDIARELGVPSTEIESTIADLHSRNLLAKDGSGDDAPARTADDKRVEAIRILCSGAMEHARETADLLARALGVARRDALTPDDEMLEQAATGDGFLARAAREGFKLVDLERAYVHAVLRVVGGNKSEAARRLGINRRTLQRRLGDGDELSDDDDNDDNDDDDDDDDVRAIRS